MSTEQSISTYIQLKLSRLFRLSKISTRLHPRFNWSNWIGWQQWLVLFGLGATVIVIEIRNHNIMWQEHHSGQTILTDSMLIWEIVFFGLVLPILAGVVLGYTGRTAIERDKMARALELRRVLITQMHEAQDWHELAELLVTTPGSVASADRTWLLAQRSEDEEFDQIAYWERPGSGRFSTYLQIRPATCESCVASKLLLLKETRILTCHCPDSANNAISCTRYCLWLSTGDRGKAALLIDMPPERPLNMAQIKVLDDLGDEMSLAIDNANLHYERQRQGDIAMNVRQRIARDLHDTLGQNISYLRLKLEQLSDGQLDTGHIEFQNELANMLRVADAAYEQMRDTLEELRTAEPLDLEETVRQYAAQVAERAGFSLQIHSSGQPGTLSARKNRQIMYILREALNNVEKHANAHNVDIDLRWGKDEFMLTVYDDGVGFLRQEINIEDRYGISIIGERSRGINAKLAIDSTLGSGTVITLSVPMKGCAVVTSRG